MSKRRKNRKKSNKLTDGGTGVMFDLEENSEEVFKEFLERDSFSQPHSEDQKFQRRKSTSRPKETEMEVDLHGLTLDEAKAKVDSTINHFRHETKQLKLRIITGKGLRSGPGGGVLVSEMYDYIKRNFRQEVFKIGEDPNQLRVSGVPLKGHFDVWLKFS